MRRLFVAGTIILHTAIFVVSWNEYFLEGHFRCPTNDKTMVPQTEYDYYTIEITTRSIRLRTMSEVNTFIPHKAGGIFLPGMIPGAFNVKVTEEAP